MKKFGLYSFIVVAMLIGGFVVYNTYTFTDFEPVIFENNRFHEVQPDENFYGNLQLVLRYYGQDYRLTREGKVKVQKRLNRDKELVSNYTRKAMDSVWLKSHVVQ